MARTQEVDDAIQHMIEDPNLYNRLAGSIAPEIYGHEDVKKVLFISSCYLHVTFNILPSLFTPINILFVFSSKSRHYCYYWLVVLVKQRETEA